MLDPKKLLDDLLGSQIPGTEGTVNYFKTFNF